jgi:membrane-associated protease RseP (regulator of RpoE activity)
MTIRPGRALATALAAASAATALALAPAPAHAAPPCDGGRGGLMRDFGFAPIPRVVRPGADGQPEIRLAGPFAIRDVRADGPAAGRVREGDALVAIDGLPIATPEAARRYLRVAPGESVRLVVARDGRPHAVTLTTGAACVPIPPAPPAPSATPAPDAPGVAAPGVAAPADPPLPPAAELLAPGLFGFAIRCDACGDVAQDGRVAFRFGRPPAVVAVTPDSPAARAGVRTGDRLTHVDGVALTGAQGWPRLAAVAPGRTVRLTFARGAADGPPFEVALRAADGR